MALTQIKTTGIADDAVTTDKLANAINTERTANTAKVSLDADSVTGAKIADDAVGAEHIEQLDADLSFADSAKAKFGAGNDLQIYHSGTHSYLDSATGTFYIRDGGSEKVRVNGYGTAITGGLLFGTDTAAANALDDYEEGTFTPSLTAGFAYAGTITYQNQTGHYTKIGNQVFAYIYLQPNGNSAHSGNLITDANNLTVGGLPFTCNNTANHEGGGYVTYINGSFGTGGVELQAMPWVPLNANYVIFHTPEDGNNLRGNETNLNNKYLIFHVRYHV